MRRWCALLFVLLLSVPAWAQERVQWRYDLDFHYYFDNRELDAAEPYLIPSGTTHAAVLVPKVRVGLPTGRNAVHSLTLGADLQHDMGAQTWEGTFREGLLYYEGQVRTERGAFKGVAGIYPRTLLKGYYSEAFFSDQNRFEDRNYEGVLLQWRGGRFFSEAALDWLGKRGYDSKERFQVISAGAWQMLRVLSLGWAADYYHYAGSEQAPGVVDHGMLHPWVKLNLAPGTGWQELSLRAGAILTYQWDRRRADYPSTPLGGEATAVVRRWNITLENTAYYGDDLMPLYDRKDLAGNLYGANLYFGHRYYTGFYDRVELHWDAKLAPGLRLRAGARAHFSQTGFMGWQQVVSLRFDLQSALERRQGR